MRGGGLWSDKNREGQEMRGMRGGREYEEGNEGRAGDEREILRKFILFQRRVRFIVEKEARTN